MVLLISKKRTRSKRSPGLDAIWLRLKITNDLHPQGAGLVARISPQHTMSPLHCMSTIASECVWVLQICSLLTSCMFSNASAAGGSARQCPALCQT